MNRRQTRQILSLSFIIVLTGIIACEGPAGADTSGEALNKEEITRFDAELYCATPVDAIARFLELDITSPEPGDAAVAMFLRLEGVEGESTDEAHEGEIDLLSIDWKTSVRVDSKGSGSGAGKVDVQDINIVKLVDKSSRDLKAAADSGARIPKATLTLRKAGGDEPVEYLKFTFDDVLITSYKTERSSDETPTEHISFTYQKIEWTWEPG
jgi:type VI secretion system secreted protein Hcp